MKTTLWRPVAGALTVAVMLVVAGGAVALAAAVKGATYRGRIARSSKVTLPISFKVSANGKRVSSFKLANGYPVYCQGGGFGTVQAGSGQISKKGTFKVKLPIYFAPSHQHQGFVIVTGTFGKHGSESGKVTTAFTAGKACNGTASYTAKG